jgi:hypothetical protein
MDNKESKNKDQAKTPSKPKNMVIRIVKIIFGLGFIFFLYKALGNRFGW